MTEGWIGREDGQACNHSFDHVTRTWDPSGVLSPSLPWFSRMEAVISLRVTSVCEARDAFNEERRTVMVHDDAEPRVKTEHAGTWDAGVVDRCPRRQSSLQKLCLYASQGSFRLKNQSPAAEQRAQKEETGETNGCGHKRRTQKHRNTESVLPRTCCRTGLLPVSSSVLYEAVTHNFSPERGKEYVSVYGIVPASCDRLVPHKYTLCKEAGCRHGINFIDQKNSCAGQRYKNCFSPQLRATSMA